MSSRPLSEITGIRLVSVVLATGLSSALSAQITNPDNTIIFNTVQNQVGIGSLVGQGNTHTGGLAWVDYNGDYLADLFVSQGSGAQHSLFRNEGDGTFTDVSFLVPKPDLEIEDAGVTYADIDNDGDYDILVTVDSKEIVDPSAFNDHDGGPNCLYINQGDGTFVEGALGSGLLDPRGWRNTAAAWADYDRDGWIDVYLTTWAPNSGPYVKHDRLMHNNGDGTFTDMSAAAGNVTGYGRDGLAISWIDLNNDFYPELYVGNVAIQHLPPNLICDDAIYLNQGDGTFFEGAPAEGTGHDTCADMGMDIADIDNDGDWDLYITDVFDPPPAPFGNPLYLGNAAGTLSYNAAGVAGVTAGNSWPCNFADFDRDGFADLWVGALEPDERSWLYVNLRNRRFKRVPIAAFKAATRNRGGSIADYDGDGDMDLAEWNFAGAMNLFRNDSLDTHRWLEFKLLGQVSNRAAIGAVVRVTVNTVTQMRRVSGGDSAHSQQDSVVHFGMRRAPRADVEVAWPSGIVQTFEDVDTNQFVIIDEQAGILTESLKSSSVRHDAQAGVLDVRVQSNYGGRTQIEVEGFGSLEYDAASLGFHGRFPVAAADLPASVNLLSSRGESWSLKVGQVASPKR